MAANIKVPDRDWTHLFSPFREVLRQILKETESLTGEPWMMAEGLRSQARQTWLYASGRTRPGPLLTKMKVPRNHGVGLGADVVPVSGYNCPESHWHVLRSVYKRHKVGPRGLPIENPAWSWGDKGHIQWPAADGITHQAAGVWVRNGFKGETPAPPTITEGDVWVDGHKVDDADLWFVEPGRIAVAIRPVTDALNWGVAKTSAGQATLVYSECRVDPNVPDEKECIHRSAVVPMFVRQESTGPRGYVRAADLDPVATAVWDGRKRVLTVTSIPDTEED